MGIRRNLPAPVRAACSNTDVTSPAANLPPAMSDLVHELSTMRYSREVSKCLRTGAASLDPDTDLRVALDTLWTRWTDWTSAGVRYVPRAGGWYVHLYRRGAEWGATPVAARVWRTFPDASVKARTNQVHTAIDRSFAAPTLDGLLALIGAPTVADHARATTAAVLDLLAAEDAAFAFMAALDGYGPLVSEALTHAWPVRRLDPTLPDHDDAAE